MRNMQLLAHPHERTEIFSLVMLLITSTGVFLPLEVALNNVWGVKQNRSYLRNQAVSLGLALAVGVLAMASVAFTTAQETVLAWVFFGHTHNVVFNFITFSFMRICAGIASILLFFLIYWVLPNRKIPARAVLPTAIVTGLLWEERRSLYPGAAVAGFSGGLRPVLYFGRVDDVGVPVGLLLLAGAHFSATRYALKLARQEEREKAVKDASSMPVPGLGKASADRARGGGLLARDLVLRVLLRRLSPEAGTFLNLTQIFVGVALLALRSPWHGRSCESACCGAFATNWC